MRENTRKIAVFFGATALFLWIGVKFLLPLLFPFLLGIGLALAAEPGTEYFSRKLRLPRGVACAVSVSGVIVLSLALVLLVLGFLMRQMRQLGSILPAMEQSVQLGLSSLQSWLSAMTEKLPGSLGIAAGGLVSNLFSGGSSLLGQAALRLPQMAGQLLGGLSEGLLWLVTSVICAYMVAARLPRLRQSLRAALPQSWRETYRPALRDLRKALGGWLLAEVKLAGVAFVLLFGGFWLLRVEQPLTWAALTTLVDIFPILGVGTVLIPWGIVCLLQGNAVRGIGILTLFAVIWLVRSVLEPKLVGKGLGLDPLITLLAIYAGFRLGGITGMLLSPLAALTVAQMIKHLQR